MLFILGIDVPNLMVAKASNEGLLQPLSSRSIQHRISLCADDVMLFLRSTAPDLELMVMILNLFGQTSGLRTNMQKSSIAPIQCSPTKIEAMQGHLTSRIEEFPIKYLGLPLSFKKLTKTQLQPFIDRLTDLLPGWKSELMTRAGRAIQV
jgi:hypothetical protein